MEQYSNCENDGTVPAGGENLDPILEMMDQEQLQRLETALQSEQAKQILGEGVTAMLGGEIFILFSFYVCFVLNISSVCR